MDELERQKTEIAERMAQAPADLPDVHPNVANIYRTKVAAFTEALNDPDGGREATDALRSLIGDVVLTPGGKRGEVNAELRGELMGILAFTRSPTNPPEPEVRTKVDACPRNHFLNCEAPALVAGVLRLAGRSIASAMAFTAAVARFSMPLSADLAGDLSDWSTVSCSGVGTPSARQLRTHHGLQTCISYCQNASRKTA
jgi:hypothetical protein